MVKVYTSQANNATMHTTEDDDVWTVVSREKMQDDSGPAHIELNPQPDGILISVYPPKAPAGDMTHMPCDIVLVIDVSVSMSDEAPVPTENPSKKESNGLSVLDLVKHAARTILESLNENDRLGVVTFSDNAKVIQKLLPMTQENRKKTWNRIDSLRVEGMTNLWHGILRGVELFDDNQRTSSTPAVMVLTDGQPNSMCPAQGYVPKLRTHTLNAPIHTFGFGYEIRSGLLKSIAEYSGGNYAFIPDPGMIGTVFVHAIANLQSAFAPSATLKISGTQGLTLVETVGEYLRKDGARTQDQLCEAETHLSIPLGSLQYGQSRDILLRYGNTNKGGKATKVRPSVEVELQCQPLDGSQGNISSECSVDYRTNMPVELVSYHRNRSTICEFLSTVAPLSDATEEHTVITAQQVRVKAGELEVIIKNMTGPEPLGALKKSALNKSLLNDLTGQIRLALSSTEYFNRWGAHFLHSIHNAHARQLCNSFKDPGPLQYGTGSPLFQKCRDELDHAFDSLPPPKPSLATASRRTKGPLVPVSMSLYNNPDGVCFAAEATVRLACGTKAQVSALRSGMAVWTPNGARKVAAVVATAVENKEMCRVGELVVTPWHPICVGQKWIFPNAVAESTVQYTGNVYSLLLEADCDDRAHGVEVGGQLAVTLGHGITWSSADDDARAHMFFGDYEKVSKGLTDLQVRDGVFECDGIARDGVTGLICGFKGKVRDVPLLTKGVTEGCAIDYWKRRDVASLQA